MNIKNLRSDIRKRALLLAVLGGTTLICSGCGSKNSTDLLKADAEPYEIVNNVQSALTVPVANYEDEHIDVVENIILDGGEHVDVEENIILDGEEHVDVEENIILDGEEHVDVEENIVLDDDMVYEEPVPMYKTYLKSKTDVNVRTVPNANSKSTIITTIKAGDVLEFVSYYDNEWYQVLYNGQYAYVCGKYFDMYQVEQNTEEAKIIRARENVRVRSANSIKSDIIGSLGVGDVLEYIDTTDDGWYKVSYKGRTAYVSCDYAEVDTEGIHREIVPVVTAKSSVNVRLESNKNSNVLYTLKKGESLLYTNKLSNGWYEVLLDGHPAYVSGKHVNVGQKEMVTNTVNGVLAMSKDSYIYLDSKCEKPIFSIPKRALCKVYNMGENYYLIKSSYGEGYVKKSSAAFLGDLAIAVDVTSQIASVYKNGGTIMNIPVITGHKTNCPTPEGIFRIKEEDVAGTMSGHNVGYPMRLCNLDGSSIGAIYLHGANEWRHKKYGGNIYINNGSLGCVNMDDDNARFIYEQYMPINGKDNRTGFNRPMVLIYESGNNWLEDFGTDVQTENYNLSLRR